MAEHFRGRTGAEVAYAADLAHHGLLGCLRELTLVRLDLSSIPTEHLASLASCVRGTFLIVDSKVCDLASILTSVTCDKLIIDNQEVGTEASQALVQAMESGVAEVTLKKDNYSGEQMNVGIAALTNYSGQGKCEKVTVMRPDSYHLRDEFESLKTWVRNNDLWKELLGNEDCIKMSKKFILCKECQLPNYVNYSGQSTWACKHVAVR